MQRLKDAVSKGASYRKSLYGPRHGISLMIGSVIAALGLAGMAVYGIIKPAPSVGDAAVVVDTDTGTPYVIREKVLHPSTNLSSAMLAAAPEGGDIPVRKQSEIVRRVNTASLDGLPRGSLLGIPDAPGDVPDHEHQLDGRWTVCDEARRDPGRSPSAPPTLRTIAILGEPGAGELPGPEVAHLVTTDAGRTGHLLIDGKRSQIDIKDNRLLLGLGIDATKVRPISRALLNTIPERPKITSPQIPDQGKGANVGQRKLSVGDIIRIQQATAADSYYLVHNDGLQKVDAVTADMVRAVTGQHADVPAVPPSDVTSAQTTRHPIDTASHPKARPVLTDAAQTPVICLDWAPAEGSPHRALYATKTVPLPPKSRPVDVPPGNTATTVQQVYVRPGWGLVVGPSPDGVSVNEGNPVLITDRGMRFPLPDVRSLRLLGLGQRVQPVSPELMNLLPQGPTLDPRAALRFMPGQPPTLPGATTAPPTSSAPTSSAPTTSAPTSRPTTSGAPSSGAPTTAGGNGSPTNSPDRNRTGAPPGTRPTTGAPTKPPTRTGP